MREERRMQQAVHTEHQPSPADKPNAKEDADVRYAVRHAEYLCRLECLCQPVGRPCVRWDRMNEIQKSRASDDLNASRNEPPTHLFPIKSEGPPPAPSLFACT